MHTWEATELRFNLQDTVPRVLFIYFVLLVVEDLYF